MPNSHPVRAVVLGGGGSKGAYQIGVWQALRELNLDYQVVTGTSVGALNGALMAQGEFDAAWDLWWNMDNTQVMEGIPPSENKPDSRLAVYRAFVREMVQKGGLDISPLEETIRSILPHYQCNISLLPPETDVSSNSNLPSLFRSLSGKQNHPYF